MLHIIEVLFNTKYEGQKLKIETENYHLNKTHPRNCFIMEILAARNVEAIWDEIVASFQTN